MRAFLVTRHGVSVLGAFASAVLIVGIGADGPPKSGAVPVSNAGATRIPDEWLEGTAESRAKRFESLRVGEAPPALAVSEWKNSAPLELANLKGKVVMLDFWATWCGPCIASIGHNNDLLERYQREGLVLIGVCHTKGAETMGETAKKEGIKYPIAADSGGKTVEAYAVDSFPDYYFIDRAGKLRILDCKNANVEEAIKLLLAEKAE